MIRRFLCSVIPVLLLSACESVPPAPVVDHDIAPPPKAAVAAPVEVKPGFYVVKKGDTLYSIALDHGQAYRDVAAWNGLTDPNRIQVGQQLRVAPPEVAPDAEEVAVASPIVAAAPLEVMAIGTSSQSAPPAAAPVAPGAADTGLLKRTPKGGKKPYSEQALALMQQPDVPASPPTPVTIKQSPAPAPAEAPAAKVPPAAADLPAWIWPASGKVTAMFQEGTNKGIDLAGRIGDPVLAAGAGKVVYVGTGIRGYGKMVIIKHNASFLSVYAHNSQVLVKEDQYVGKGQRIAEIGDTDSDQPKLHFEIRYMNKPVDPLKYLPGR